MSSMSIKSRRLCALRELFSRELEVGGGRDSFLVSSMLLVEVQVVTRQSITPVCFLELTEGNHEVD